MIETVAVIHSSLMLAVMRLAQQKGVLIEGLQGYSWKELSSLADWSGHRILVQEQEFLGSAMRPVHRTHRLWMGKAKVMGVATALLGCFQCNQTSFLVERHNSGLQSPWIPWMRENKWQNGTCKYLMEREGEYWEEREREYWVERERERERTLWTAPNWMTPSLTAISAMVCKMFESNQESTSLTINLWMWCLILMPYLYPRLELGFPCPWILLRNIT